MITEVNMFLDMQTAFLIAFCCSSCITISEISLSYRDFWQNTLNQLNLIRTVLNNP